MNGTEAKKIFIQQADQILEQLGFKENKNRTISAIYIRKKDNGFEDIGVATYNYSPEVVLNIGTGKRIDLIEDILTKINEKFSLSLKIDNQNNTVIHQGNSLQRNYQLRSVENLDTEQGVIESTKILLEYIEQEVVPLYDLFDDLKEIDHRINGEGENYREGDTGNKNIYSFGQYFHERRLIIAWLCNNTNFEVLVDRTFKYYEKSMEEHTGEPYIYDRNDLSLSIPATVKYLKEYISPIK